MPLYHEILAQKDAPPASSCVMLPMQEGMSQKPPVPTTTIPPACTTPTASEAQCCGQLMVTAAAEAFSGVCTMVTCAPVALGTPHHVPVS